MGLAEPVTTCHDLMILFSNERSLNLQEKKDKNTLPAIRTSLGGGGTERTSVGKAVQFLFQQLYFSSVSFEPRQTATES